jgi:hypothetical protein
MSDAVPVELRAIVAETRRLKNQFVRRGEPDNMAHIIEFGRDGKRVIRALVDHAEVLLDIIAKTIPAVAADSVTSGMDAYRYSQPTAEATDLNPITGRPWEIGDMAEIAKMDAGVERGIIGESLHFIHATRGGAWIGGDLPYRRHPKGHKVIYEGFRTWNAERLDEVFGTAVRKARFPRVIAEAFAEPTVLDKVDAAKHGYTDRDTLRIVTRMAGEYIDAAEHAVLLEAKL